MRDDHDLLATIDREIKKGNRVYFYTRVYEALTVGVDNGNYKVQEDISYKELQIVRAGPEWLLARSIENCSKCIEKQKEAKSDS